MLSVGIPDKAFEFQVGPGSVALTAPCVEPLAHLLRVPMQPIALLRELKAVGVCLMPCDADASIVDMDLKMPDVERAMCTDVASLAGSHVIASSKWTQYVGVRITPRPRCLFVAFQMLEAVSHAGGRVHLQN
jgi:hypothetical protein